MFGMACVLCRWLRRSIGRDDPLWLKASDQVQSDILFADWNTNALFEADADPVRLRELAALWQKSPDEAFPRFLALAEAGSVWSMIRVAHGYSKGHGVARDEEAAERWCTAAFFEGGSDYGLIYGAKLARRRGDVSKARRLLEAGAERGPLQAKVDLADLILDGPKAREGRDRARSLYEAAIAGDCLPARAAMAKAMALGRFGWRAIPEGLSRLRESLHIYDGLVEAKRRTLLAGVEVRHASGGGFAPNAPETLRQRMVSDTSGFSGRSKSAKRTTSSSS